MKWRLVLLLLMLFVSSSFAENDLYSMESLELRLNVEGSLELVPTKSGADIKEVTADLFLYPQESQRQKIILWDSEGIVKDEMVSFFWNDGQIEKKKFGYAALIATQNQRLAVKEKISFPLRPQDVQGLEQYLEPTETIDSDHPAVIAKAAELAEGEDDLFKVAFNLASWVEEHIEYDLNTVTSAASQKGSWVLQNKQGVCDEMTSLFVAMARSLGIPARFVSGISYTNSQEVVNAVGSNWAGHGWAEVYFPEIGWVSFDVTFNQYGYVDVTHLRLRDSFDPTEPAVKYEWVSDGVKLEKGKLGLEVTVEKEGAAVPEQIQLEQEILAHEVGFGSYNLVKGVVRNNAHYYAATALNLAAPKEVEVIGRNRRNILLPPREVRETFWMVKIPENLQENYVYTFPVRIYSEKNASVDDTFTAQVGKNTYSKAEIEELSIQDEEKSYSQKITFDCQYKKEIMLGEEAPVTCSIKNTGNTNFKSLTFCVGDACETADLPINQKKNIEVTVKGENAGWQKVIVRAENKEVEKKMPLEYAVLDTPQLTISAKYPPVIQFGDSPTIEISLQKDSFAEPRNLALAISGAGAKSVWDIPGLGPEEKISYLVDGQSLSRNTEFIITANWEDRQGKAYSTEQKIIVKAEGNSFADKVKMLSNWLINLFVKEN
ncbi:MAG: transglutaminase-like domain-containing protein [Nanoarchaeota archaeon]|nr:transglutaminase-like domain-containing protein [Nanoarchaeota archaeon]